MQMQATHITGVRFFFMIHLNGKGSSGLDKAKRVLYIRPCGSEKKEQEGIWHDCAHEEVDCVSCLPMLSNLFSTEGY